MAEKPIQRLILAGLSVGALALGSAFAPAQANSPGAAHDPSIVVGVLATLSGSGAVAGQDAVDGFQLSLRNLGSRFANQEVRVVVADDKGLPEQALGKINTMIAEERVDVVVTATQPSALLNILPALEKAKLMTINVGQTPPILAGQRCSPLMLHLAPNVNSIQEAMGKFLGAEGYRRPIIVGPELPLTDRAVEAFRMGYPGEVHVLRVKPGTPLFTPIVDEVKAYLPDVVYSILQGGMNVGFMRALGESSLKTSTDIYGTSWALERPFLPAQGDGAFHSMSIAPWSPDLDDPISKRFVQEFEMEMGRPATIWAMYGFEAALALDSALKQTKGQTANNGQLRAALMAAQIPSIRGVLKFAPNQVAASPLVLRKVVWDAKERPTHELIGVISPDWKDSQANLCSLPPLEALRIR